MPAAQMKLELADEAKRAAIKPANKLKLPMIEGLEEPKPLVCGALCIVENLYEEWSWPGGVIRMTKTYSRWAGYNPELVQAELRAMLSDPKLPFYFNQQWRFWSFVINQQKQTLIFCRNHSPMAFLLFLMAQTGSRFSKQFVDGDYCESDFPVLTSSAGKLWNAPIRFCDAKEPTAFLRMLSDAHKSFEYAVCDWILEGDELAAAQRLTKDSPITFLCPVNIEIKTEGLNSEPRS